MTKQLKEIGKADENRMAEKIAAAVVKKLQMNEVK